MYKLPYDRRPRLGAQEALQRSQCTRKCKNRHKGVHLRAGPCPCVDPQLYVVVILSSQVFIHAASMTAHCAHHHYALTCAPHLQHHIIRAPGSRCEIKHEVGRPALERPCGFPPHTLTLRSAVTPNLNSLVCTQLQHGAPHDPLCAPMNP